MNGEDEGLLAKRTWPADTELTYPPEREAPYYVGFGRPVKISPR